MGEPLRNDSYGNVLVCVILRPSFLVHSLYAFQESDELPSVFAPAGSHPPCVTDTAKHLV